MLERLVKEKIIASFKKFPIIGICGPRQSGKTTLAKQAFNDLDYVNLEDPSLRELVQHDPKGFLDKYKKGLIIDEIQYVPEFFSYLQIYSDERDKPGQYVITGPQYFLLNEKIAQSLAGHISVFNLLPLSYYEIKEQLPQTYYARGALFENYVLLEMVKHKLNQGLRPDLFFLHNKTGQEVDIVCEKSNQLQLIEVKASNTMSASFLKNITYWIQIIKNAKGFLIYNGTDLTGGEFKGTSILNWKNLYDAM